MLKFKTSKQSNSMNSDSQDEEVNTIGRRDKKQMEKPNAQQTLFSKHSNNFVEPCSNGGLRPTPAIHLNSSPDHGRKKDANRHVHFPNSTEQLPKNEPKKKQPEVNHRQRGKLITKGRFAGFIATPIVENDHKSKERKVSSADSHSDSARSQSSCSNDTWDGKESFLLHSRTNSVDTFSDGGSWSGRSYGNSSGHPSYASGGRMSKPKARVDHSDVIRKTLAKDFKDVLVKSRAEEVKYKQKVYQYISAEGKVRDYLLSTEKHLPYSPSSDNDSSICCGSNGSNSTSSDVIPPPVRFRKTIKDLSSGLLIRIFSNLSTRDLVTASQVCKKWYRISWTPDLWSAIDVSGYGGDVNSVVESILSRLTEVSPYACLVINTWKFNACKNLTDESLKLIGRRCPELKYLELAKCSLVTGVGVSEIFANCPNLSLINVASCPEVSTIDFTHPNGVSYGENASFLQLHYIDLSECLVNDSGLDMIARSCGFLEYLYLRRCEAITDKGLISIANYCTGIRELSVSDCINIGDSGCKFLVKKCNDLRYISLAKCAITDETVKYIAKYCKKIRYLNMHMCHSVGDEGVARVAQNCEKIRALDNGKCEKVTDTSLNFISVNCPHLRRLNIKGCERMTDSGLRKLATHCRSLKHLNIQECDFSFETYLYLRQRCVNCVIEHTKPEFC